MKTIQEVELRHYSTELNRHPGHFLIRTLQYNDTGVRNLAVPPITECPSIEMHGVKRDLKEKLKMLMRGVHLTTKLYGPSDAHPRYCVFLYTGTLSDRQCICLLKYVNKCDHKIGIMAYIIIQSHYVILEQFCTAYHGCWPDFAEEKEQQESFVLFCFFVFVFFLNKKKTPPAQKN